MVNSNEKLSVENRLAAIQDAELQLKKSKGTYTMIVGLLVCILILMLVAVMLVYTRC